MRTVSPVAWCRDFSLKKAVVHVERSVEPYIHLVTVVTVPEESIIELQLKCFFQGKP